MTAGRFFGFDRSLSARFSLLLAVPAIIGAGRWVATISSSSTGSPSGFCCSGQKTRKGWRPDR
jgi:undecaprenyl pyrophosphate phosphatase UppP